MISIAGRLSTSNKVRCFRFKQETDVQHFRMVFHCILSQKAMAEVIFSFHPFGVSLCGVSLVICVEEQKDNFNSNKNCIVVSYLNSPFFVPLKQNMMHSQQRKKKKKKKKNHPSPFLQSRIFQFKSFCFAGVKWLRVVQCICQGSFPKSKFYKFVFGILKFWDCSQMGNNSGGWDDFCLLNVGLWSEGTG